MVKSKARLAAEWMRGLSEDSGSIHNSDTVVSIGEENTWHIGDRDTNIPVTGPKGDQGIQGIRGVQGPLGPNGGIGPTGDKGPVGNQGPVGNIGPQGPVGSEGPQGPAGTAAVPLAFGRMNINLNGELEIEHYGDANSDDFTINENGELEIQI